jgi:hypothetical protein
MSTPSLRAISLLALAFALVPVAASARVVADSGSLVTSGGPLVTSAHGGRVKKNGTTRNAGSGSKGTRGACKRDCGHTGRGGNALVGNVGALLHKRKR